MGGDAWGFEVLDPDVTMGTFFPVHQVLIVQHGIRIGEGMRTEDLVADNVFQFVIMLNPEQSMGATRGTHLQSRSAPRP